MLNEWELYYTNRNLFELLIKWYKETHGYFKLANHIIVDTNIKVLELGAGEAHIGRILVEKGCDVTAIDCSEIAIKKYSKFVNSYHYGSVFELPFSNDKFDLVVSCGLLEHFSLEDARKIIREARRVGKYQIHFYPKESWLWRVWWWLRRVPRDTYKHRPQELGLIDYMFGTEKFGLLEYYYVKGK